MTLTKSNNTDALTLPCALKRRILSTKGFWQNWGDNSTRDWTILSLDDFEEYLVTDSRPNASLQTTTVPTTAMDVTTISNAISTAMLVKPPPSCVDLFMKNKGGGDDVKPLKEPKQWNTWQWTFLSTTHSYDFMDITDISYSPDSLDHDEVDHDEVNVFKLKQKHAFTILVANVKEPSVLPIICKYADSNATHYGNAQLLYYDIVAHYTQGLTRRQCLEIIEKKLDGLRLDMKWGKTCESFLNHVDNKLKDHQGIAPNPMQFPHSWYITRLNLTLELHTTLYQFIVNHQMQANAIAHHTGTPSAAATTYESHLEHVQTFCQMINHTNHKAVQEKTRCKALQAEFERAVDMDGMAGEKDMAVGMAVVMGGVETLGMVGNLKDEEGAPVGGDTFLSMFRLCSCGTKPQRSENHHFVMTSSWEPQCHHDIIMRTPRITGKPKFSWSGGP